MSESLVKYEIKNRIAYIQLNRPQAKNALNDELNTELEKAWTDFAHNEAADVGILYAAGNTFCAGADLKSFIPKWADSDPCDLRTNQKLGIAGGITRGKHRLYKPLIAAIQGYAVGGGLELALCCDIRIAAENAKFGVFEVRQGLHQGDGGLTRLLAVAGLGVALDLSLTGREVSAQEAKELRLVNQVVSQEKLLETAENVAQVILKNSQSAVRSAKETLYELVGRSLDDSLRLEALYGYSSFGSTEVLKEKLARFK